MKFSKNQTGFSAAAILIIVVVIGVVGFAGVSVYNRQQDKTATTSTNQPASSDQSATADDVPSAPEINSTEDLDKAQAVLDQTDPSTSNDNDASQLDFQLAEF